MMHWLRKLSLWDFVQCKFTVIIVTCLLVSNCSPAAKSRELFSTDIACHQWLEFRADGFDAPVSGIVYRTNDLPCCGVPLGGISTGCLDLDPNGTFGFC